MMRIIALTKTTTGSVSTVPWPRQGIGSPSRTIQPTALAGPSAGGLFTEDSGPIESRSKRFGELLLPPPRNDRSLTALMIADAARYVRAQPETAGLPWTRSSP